MNIAIIGGGINGLCAAWQLAVDGYSVKLFERGKLLSETSSSSSKLLHGGIRYLENFEFSLVKESLRERDWWLRNVPQHTSVTRLFLPVYKNGRRPFWKMKLGLMLYDWLAGSQRLAQHEVFSGNDSSMPEHYLKRKDMQKLCAFYDGQMDEVGLGTWVAEQAMASGVELLENCEVSKINAYDGSVVHDHGCEQHDLIINMAGPWAPQLNARNGILTQHRLDLVRGSHIVLDCSYKDGYLLEVPGERRIFFVLPYQGKTLVGTTEIRQTLDESIQCSNEEKAYLLAAYNHYFVNQMSEQNIVSDFSGVRPLIQSSSDPGRATREYAIEKSGKVMTVFGGKWTTSRALAKKIVKEVNNGFH